MRVFYIWCSTIVFGSLATVDATVFGPSVLGSVDEGLSNAASICGISLFLLGCAGFMIWWVPNWIRFRRSILLRELEKGEQIWGSAHVNYQIGWTWAGIVGRLFLTNQVLEFRASPGQGSVEILKMPLGTIRRARALWVFIGFSDLRVDRNDGSFFVFHFGPFANTARDWAQAIMKFRDDLEDEFGEEQTESA
jgi:hypothetical protein